MVRVGEKQHYYWLDAIRFIAAFVVLLSHTRNDFFLAYGDLPSEQHTIVNASFYFIGRMGHEAVIVFFVLSGFLVGGRGIERIKDGRFTVQGYAIDRFSRIYPPLLLSIIIYFITCQFIETEQWNWWRALGNVLNLQGFACESLISPYWSLTYEWWFYIVFGAISFSLKTRKTNHKILGFVIACVSISVFLLGKMRMLYLVIWFLGTLAYLCRPIKFNRIVLLLSLLGIVICIFLYQFSKSSHSLNIPIEISRPAVVELILAVNVCLLLQQAIIVEPKSLVSKKIEKGLGYMGKFSYSLYLSHRIVLMWLFFFCFSKKRAEISLTNAAIYICIIIICIVCCWFLYFISERYTPQVKEKMKSLIL